MRRLVSIQSSIRLHSDPAWGLIRCECRKHTEWKMSRQIGFRFRLTCATNLIGFVAALVGWASRIVFGSVKISWDPNGASIAGSAQEAGPLCHPGARLPWRTGHPHPPNCR